MATRKTTFLENEEFQATSIVPKNIPFYPFHSVFADLFEITNRLYKTDGYASEHHTPSQQFYFAMR